MFRDGIHVRYESKEKFQINCKINLQGNLAIIYVHPRNHNLLHRLIKEQIFQTNRTIYHVNNHLMMIRDTKYSELNSFR